MSEYAHHVESFRKLLAQQCEIASLRLNISNLDIARVLQKATTEKMMACLDDPRDVVQIKKMIEDAAREMDEAIGGQS